MHTNTHIWVHTHICAFLTYILTIYNNYVNNNYLKLWITMTKISIETTHIARNATILQKMLRNFKM